MDNRSTFLRAFTLLELSIGLTILSLLAAGALTVGGVMVEQQQFTGTAQRVADAQKALTDYFTVNGRLPCPARMTLAVGDTAFGTEIDCTVTTVPGGTWRPGSGALYSNTRTRIGALPVRTLGLRDNAMSDEYGNRIWYAMSESFANSGNIAAAQGSITILDGGTTNIADPAATPQTGAAFAVFSTGPDGKGGYRYQTGSQSSSCTAGYNDTTNCSTGSATFRDTRFNNGSTAANFFDDTILWMPKYLLTTRSDSTAAAAPPVSSVQFNNNGFFGGSANFVWDATNNRVGIGTTTPLNTLHVAGGALTTNRTGVQIGPAGTDGPLFLVHNSPSIGGNAYYNGAWRYGGGTSKPGIIWFGSDGINFAVSNATGTLGAAVPEFATGVPPVMKLSSAGNLSLDGDFSNTGTITAAGNIRTTASMLINNTGPVFYLQDSDHRSAGIHVNSNTFYILRGSGTNSTSWAQYGSYWPLSINLETNETTLGGVLRVPAGGIISAGGATGINATGSTYGVVATGSTYGIVSDGNTGILGRGSSGNGVVGEGASVGVVGRNTGNSLVAQLATASLGVWTNGNMQAVAFNTSSDRRLKKDITPLSSGMLDSVMQLKPVSYRFKTPAGPQDGTHYGFIAQDVRKVMPDLVTGETEDNKYLSINYDGLIAPLVATVQELKRTQDAHSAALAERASIGASGDSSQHRINLLFAGLAGVQFVLWLFLAWRQRQIRKRLRDVAL